MSRSLCPSIIRMRSCMNVLLPSPRLMTSEGAAPKSHNHGGEWMDAEHRKAPSTLFPLIPCNKNQQAGADKAQGTFAVRGHIQLVRLGEGSTWRKLGAHDAH